jgi:mono/diheme cytochrome c family protein
MKRILFALIPVLLVMILYEGLILYDNLFPYGRMRETPAIRPQEEPLLRTEEGLVPYTGGEALLRVTDGKDLKAIVDMADPVTVQQGQKVYALYCQQCHGRYHDGNGTVGQSFHPLPTDLMTEKVQQAPDGVLFKEIGYGIPGGRQPPLATTVDMEDRWRVIAYIKSLGLRK